jgi:hypothetical protein
MIKGYGADAFNDDSSSIGYRIDVYQESINQLISEYLVNFDYLDRVMDSYGFQVISREEASEIGFPEGSGLFSELFIHMLDEISKNKFKTNEYGEAKNMTKYEQKISFLNRYFIYKKIREVNSDKVELNISEYEDNTEFINMKETKEAVKVAKEVKRTEKPKIRKLSKKLLLVPATDVNDEAEDKELMTVQPKEKKKTEKKKVKKNQPLLIIEDDED